MSADLAEQSRPDSPSYTPIESIPIRIPDGHCGWIYQSIQWRPTGWIVFQERASDFATRESRRRYRSFKDADYAADVGIVRFEPWSKK